MPGGFDLDRVGGNSLCQALPDDADGGLHFRLDHTLENVVLSRRFQIALCPSLRLRICGAVDLDHGSSTWSALEVVD
jgi:hypothetical protein